jgi:class 3 adenylate cyclase/pimeloyl-ACP methyl ester carboxylesterase
VRPETTYTKTPQGYVGYQVFGHGPLDILFITNWATNVEVMWDEPSLVRFMERLASFARVICFDRRGTGVSDPVPLAELPTIEEWMDDARAVIDAAGSERTAVIGDTEGGPMAMLLAAAHPERVAGLVLLNTFARMLRADDYPIGLPPASVPRLLEVYEAAWGTPAVLELTAPAEAGDPRLGSWFARYQRLAMPPGASARMFAWVLETDVRAVLPNIRAPTLVLHRRDNRYHRLPFGEYLAAHIPGARLVVVPGAESFPYHAGDFEPVLEEIQEFLTGVREPPAPDRMLGTLLFTDIVGSTDHAARLGDSRWLDVRASHDAVVRRLLDRYRGREEAFTGDGFLATFDGPVRAVRCAWEIAQDVRPLGVEVRAGLHTGEIELREGGIGGIAVHIAARVMAEAAAGGVFASQTVKDLVVGSGIEFSDRGVRPLKGVPGEWRLFEVTAVP